MRVSEGKLKLKTTGCDGVAVKNERPPETRARIRQAWMQRQSSRYDARIQRGQEFSCIQ